MAEPPHVMLVEARFYEDIADELARGAVAALEAAGATHERHEVPGALEVPAAIRYAVRAMELDPERRRSDGFVALGCVIRGETGHYDIVAGESARGLQELALTYSLAVGNGILTCDSREQATARAAVDGRNKGGQAARACLDMIELKRRFRLFPR
ncbi:MAG: 6,7-dimethyl-8-ribityllumazine synthase [Alphaproteobacteria bacterium]